MEREEKGGERDGEEEGEGKEELMGIKLERGILVGKRGGPSTPPPTWSFVGFQDPQTKTHKNSSSSAVTARQLGANLWEIIPHLHSLSKMSKASSSGLRRQNHYHSHRVSHHSDQKNKGLQIQPVLEEGDPPESDGLPEQPGSTGSFHRQMVESLRRHDRPVDRHGRAIEPVSPASFSNSMELTPYNPGATPSSSVGLRGRIGDSNYSLKTSTELLKVLNRIWSLEEQHASNVSLVRALKTELGNSRARIKDLLKEKQMDRQVMDDLMKRLAEDKFARQNIEQERIKSALQSVRAELEDERKLRRRSESLHRKLARELTEVKSSFSKAIGELERERRARVLLEGLCDEFAIGIRDYEQELRSLHYKTEKDRICSTREYVDSLVLHMSEAWLDERVQMKLAEESEEEVAAAATQKDMVVEKLSSEIEVFLKAREQSISSRKADEFYPSTRELKDHHSKIRRHSLESFHLNEATSAPKHADDDESVNSESNCFELSKPVNDLDMEKKEVKNDAGGSGGMSRMQARFEQHMAKAILSNASSDNRGKSKRFASQLLGSTNHMVECLARNNSSSVEGDRIHPEDALVDESHGRLMLAGPTSPVKKWEPKIGLQDPKISESFPKQGSNEVKENTLKARLMEARLEGRQRHSHSRAYKG